MRSWPSWSARPWSPSVVVGSRPCSATGAEPPAGPRSVAPNFASRLGLRPRPPRPTATSTSRPTSPKAAAPSSTRAPPRSSVPAAPTDAAADTGSARGSAWRIVAHPGRPTAATSHSNNDRRMHMPDLDTVRSWQGATMVDTDGDKIGTIESIYLDDQTGEPEWALVNTGLFGTKSSFVPLAQAASSGDQVQVPYDKQLVKDAPRVDTDQHLSEAEEQELWTHYGLDYGSGYSDTADRDGDGIYDQVQDTAVGRDTSGPTTDQAMTRSEEELQVGTTQRERGRVRLRK